MCNKHYPYPIYLQKNETIYNSYSGVCMLFFFPRFIYIYIYIYIKFNCDDEPCIVYIEKQFEEKKMINIGI